MAAGCSRFTSTTTRNSLLCLSPLCLGHNLQDSSLPMDQVSATAREAKHTGLTRQTSPRESHPHGPFTTWIKAHPHHPTLVHRKQHTSARPCRS